MSAPRSTLVALLILPLSTAAQSVTDTAHPPEFVRPPYADLMGSELRVRSTSTDSTEARVGTLVRSGPDSLWLAVAGRSTPVPVGIERGTIVEGWHRSDPTARYTVVGGLVGALIGGVAASVLNDPPEPRRCSSGYEGWSAALCAIGADAVTQVEGSVDGAMAVAAGVALGVAAGGLVGRFYGRSRIEEGWRAVPAPELTLRPGRHGDLEVGLELRR